MPRSSWHNSTNIDSGRQAPSSPIQDSHSSETTQTEGRTPDHTILSQSLTRRPCMILDIRAAQAASPQGISRRWEYLLPAPRLPYNQSTTDDEDSKYHRDDGTGYQKCHRFPDETNDSKTCPREFGQNVPYPTQRPSKEGELQIGKTTVPWV